MVSARSWSPWPRAMEHSGAPPMPNRLEKAVMITEAMKMETAIEARFDGEIAHVYVTDGDAIASGDLLIEVTEK